MYVLFVNVILQVIFYENLSIIPSYKEIFAISVCSINKYQLYIYINIHSVKEPYTYLAVITYPQKQRPSKYCPLPGTHFCQYIYSCLNISISCPIKKNKKKRGKKPKTYHLPISVTLSGSCSCHQLPHSVIIYCSGHTGKTRVYLQHCFGQNYYHSSHSCFIVQHQNF